MAKDSPEKIDDATKHFTDPEANSIQEMQNNA
jgi:hypothetical protein